MSNEVENTVEAFDLINPTAEAISEFITAIEASDASRETKMMANDLARYFDEVTMELQDDISYVKEAEPSMDCGDEQCEFC